MLTKTQIDNEAHRLIRSGLIGAIKRAGRKVGQKQITKKTNEIFNRDYLFHFIAEQNLRRINRLKAKGR